MSSAPLLPPPLRSGERLTREEFLRRWDSQPELKTAELINGVVYMPSPVSKAHSKADSLIIGWLVYYAASTPGSEAGNNGTWLMMQSAPQPDAHLYLLPECGGQAHEEGPFLGGAPELAVEVCQTSSQYDLGPKLQLYQQAQVQEYLTIVLQNKEVIWRSLSADRYERIPVDADGLLRSLVFPGLWLDPAAVFNGDPARLLEALQQGLASPEHREFAQRLRRQLPSS